MFNLLVSGNSERWEEPPYGSSVDRFKEYSGAEATAIDLAHPDTLRFVEGIPTLLMYEVGVGGPHAWIVRHGRLHDVVRRGRELTFSFEPDSERTYLDRRIVLSFAERLGIVPFEQHRTHWAIKDGDLPPELLATATAERRERTLRIVAAEFVDARRSGIRGEVRELEEELEQFPPTLEKAMLLVPVRILDHAEPELYPILGIEPRTPEGRTALDAVLAIDPGDDGVDRDRPFSLASFLSLYGSPTEEGRRTAAIERCGERLAVLGSTDAGDDVEQIAHALWRCSRSPMLVERLRREVALLVDRLVRRQSAAGYWPAGRDSSGPAAIRATALAAVSLQRLGDDRHHRAIRGAVDYLISHREAETGALVRFEGDAAPDVLATALAMEAIRRSDVAGEVPHVLDAGDAWLVSAQSPLGGWVAEPCSEGFVTASVLEYMSRRAEILPQVDGFLLMARGFFRKAEELRAEGGSNNRRLAAIATVHAVEMFLYGLFEHREDLALSAFKENGIETLGPREALRALQEALQRLKLLERPNTLARRDKLSSLIGRRDGIIHRAHEISEAELAEGIKHAKYFITKYGKDLLSLDLLQ